MSGNNLKQFAKDILEDGVIDEAEVSAIRAKIFDDGVIDQEEADFLFDLNDGTNVGDNHASWQALFVEAISSYVLDDESSPNEIDSDEGDWLLNRIEGDGVCDANEIALLKNIQKKALRIDGKLNEKIGSLIK